MAQQTLPDHPIGAQVVGACRALGGHSAWSFVVVTPSGHKIHVLGQAGESADLVLRRALDAAGLSEHTALPTDRANAAASLAAQSITLLAAGAAA